MKVILVISACVCCSAIAVFADEKQFADPFDDKTAQQPEPTRKPETTTDKTSAGEWKPKFRINLQLTEDGLDKTEVQNETIPVTVYVQQQVATSDPSGRRRVSTVSRPVTRHELVTRSIVTPGRAVLVTDDVGISLMTSEKSGQEYSFTCEGRARLLLGDLTVDAESMDFKSGVLTITNARLSRGATVFRSKEMQIDLAVHGLATQKFGLPLGQLSQPSSRYLQPQPDPAFERSRDDLQTPHDYDSQPMTSGERVYFDANDSSDSPQPDVFDSSRWPNKNEGRDLDPNNLDDAPLFESSSSSKGRRRLDTSKTFDRTFKRTNSKPTGNDTLSADE